MRRALADGKLQHDEDEEDQELRVPRAVARDPQQQERRRVADAVDADHEPPVDDRGPLEEALLDAGTVRVRLALIDRALTGKLDQRGVQDALGLFGKVLELDPGNPVAGKRIEELKAIVAVD